MTLHISRTECMRGGRVTSKEERACCWKYLKEDNDALSFFRRQESATLRLSKVKVAVGMSSEALRV